MRMMVFKSRLRDMPCRLDNALAADMDPTVTERLLRAEIDDLFEQLERQVLNSFEALTRHK